MRAEDIHEPGSASQEVGGGIRLLEEAVMTGDRRRQAGLDVLAAAVPMLQPGQVSLVLVAVVQQVAVGARRRPVQHGIGPRTTPACATGIVALQQRSLQDQCLRTIMKPLNFVKPLLKKNFQAFNFKFSCATTAIL